MGWEPWEEREGMVGEGWEWKGQELGTEGDKDGRERRGGNEKRRVDM